MVQNSALKWGLFFCAGVICSLYIVSMMNTRHKIISIDFEVYGRVQGVFFRKHTQKRGKQLGLKGWCMNTERGTVQGVMEGAVEQIEEMKRWLQFIGSPLSKIEKTEFSNERQLLMHSYTDFKIRR